jgi:hypothetical protein
MRPCAARTCLFSLINTQKTALRASPLSIAARCSSLHLTFCLLWRDLTTVLSNLWHSISKTILLPPAGIEPRALNETMPALGRDTKELAKQLQIGPFGTLTWRENPSLGEAPRTNSAVLVNEWQRDGFNYASLMLKNRYSDTYYLYICVYINIYHSFLYKILCFQSVLDRIFFA